MDEGTAQLDIQHEQAVNAAIAGMGITHLIVHREEPITQADRVLALAGGQIHDLQDLIQQQQSISSPDSNPIEGTAP